MGLRLLKFIVCYVLCVLVWLVGGCWVVWFVFVLLLVLLFGVGCVTWVCCFCLLFLCVLICFDVGVLVLGI